MTGTGTGRRLPTTIRTLRTAAVLAGALLLAACGGMTGAPTPPAEPEVVPPPPEETAAERLAGLIERADTLLLTAPHTGYALTGTAGTDWLGGNFHGPAHEEAWGAFDTAGYIGAFGAKRRP